MTRILFLGLLLIGTAFAENAKERIRSSYNRCARAASFKFYPTMIGNRTSDYESFAPDGARLDLSLEPQRYGILFQSALKVVMTTQIQNFRQVDGEHCNCQVLQEMTVSRPQGKEKKPVAVTLRTVSLDEWQLTSLGWRLRRRKLQQQAYQDAEKLP